MYAIYVRQSIDKKDSISIESQIEFCKSELKCKEYKIYSDKGYSGKNTDRPQLQQMLNDIKSGIIKGVIVYRIDRLSRSIRDFANMDELFQEYRVDFISHDEKFDTSTQTGKMMLNIFMAFAQHERETIQQRVTDAYYSRCKKGFYMGGKIPYGFSIEETYIDGKKTSKFIENPQESEHIKLIYKLYADPKNSLGDIVKYFNKNNIKHFRGSKWTVSRISDFLRNPVYVMADADIYSFFAGQGTEIVSSVNDFTGTNGCYLYNLTKDKVNKNSSLKNKHLVLALHRGFITSDLWLKCRMRCMNNKQCARSYQAKNSWLLGKVKCGKCGGRLNITKSDTKMGRYFLCGTMIETKHSLCNGTGCTVYADELESVISDKIRHELSKFDSLSYSETNKSQPQINEIKIRISQIDTEISNLVNKVIMADDVLMRLINEQVNKLDKERQALNAQLTSLNSNISGEIISEMSSLIQNWQSLSFEDKHAITDTLIDVISVADGHINIRWKIHV
ncbi:MAG: recombinase family protein [Ruminococcus sp.]|nr:recombinase family protein [Ruminococcus sp.]